MRGRPQLPRSWFIEAQADGVLFNSPVNCIDFRGFVVTHLPAEDCLRVALPSFDLLYAAIAHNHNGTYALIGHDHDLVYAPIVHSHNYEAAGAVASHAAANDPHTGYQKESEKGSANGYASLGADGKVPSDQLPASQGGAAWGGVTGTLSDQTDLQTALDAKSSSTHDHDIDYAALGHNHDAAYEAKNANIQAHIESTANPHSVTKEQVGLGNVDNTSDAAKPISTATQTALDAKQNSLGFTAENSANKGQANGYASLDSSGKVPSAQLPASSGGQSLVVAAGAADSSAVSNVNVNHFSKAVTVAAGDVFWFEVHGRVHNNSGATRTYTHGIGLGGLTLDCVASTTIAANTVAAFGLWGTIAVRSTSSVYWTVFCDPLPATTDNGAAGTSVARRAWRTSATNITGEQTALAYMRSSGTGTQNRWVHGYTLRQIGAI